MKRIITDIEDNEHHEFKLAVLKDNKTISEVIKSFIKKYMIGKK